VLEVRPAGRGKDRQELLQGLFRGLDLGHVIEAVYSRYGVDRAHVAVRRSPAPARAALAYLVKHLTESTRAELVPIPGFSRSESVPNLSSRFATLLRTQASVRRDLKALELALKLRGENSEAV